LLVFILNVISHPERLDAKKVLASRDFVVGEEMLDTHDLKKKHPVVLVPGIVSTGLESWSTHPKARGFFRKRLWVSWMSRGIS
jgi:phospholipid:diacylglycerol acyltransferase